VIEAVSENLELKKKIWTGVDAAAKPSAIFASNTSSISITELAAATRRPERFCGMHFMNPVPVMKLVEGIRGIQTSDETFKIVRETAEKMGKTFVVARDMPGFAVNRILMPMINEAVYALYEGIASVEDIDVAMKLGTHQPMGPLTLADFIGLDTCLAIMEVLHEGLGDSKYRPCPLLKQYVTAGWLGKKSGRGFYKYD
jgi:3-hydroxybutyryl-CoA dehydrogenase